MEYFFFWLDYLSFGFNLMKPKANFEKCKQRSTKKYNKKHNFGKKDNSYWHCKRLIGKHSLCLLMLP